MSGAYVVPASRVPDRLCSGCMTEADVDPQIIADEFEAWVANGMPAGSQPPSFDPLGFRPKREDLQSGALLSDWISDLRYRCLVRYRPVADAVSQLRPME
jgi:hypothetical protein